MTEFIKEHKKISYFAVFILFFYFFIIIPTENIIDNKNNMRNKTARLENIKIKHKAVEKNIDRRETERERLKEQLAEISEKENSFSSLGEFQSFLNGFLIKNNIEILEIARGEKTEESEYIIPYTVTGNEKDIIKFIKEAENDKNINLMKGPIELSVKENSVVFRFSAGVKISEKKENMSGAERKSRLLTEEKEEIKLVKYNFLGKDTGVFYFKSGEKIKRYYLKNNKIIIVDKHMYEVNITGEKLVLKDVANRENIKIFILEEKVEKKN